MRFALAQVTAKLGAFEENLAKCLKVWSEQEGEVDLIIFSELFLTGYPLEDLVENPDFLSECDRVLAQLLEISLSKSTAIVITHPIKDYKKIYNALLLIEKGEIVAKIYKSHLPNYSIFDEKRNFKPGRNNNIVNWRGKNIGFLICEDAWGLKIPEKLVDQGAEILISLNASPYDMNKAETRYKLVKRIVTQNKVPFIYVNSFGAQDEIVFDGGSFVLDKNGTYIVEPVFWQEQVVVTDMKPNGMKPRITGAQFTALTGHESVYNALILGLRSYIHNNGFSKAIIGVSGGIDSSFVSILSADAIGADNIELVKLPSKYSSHHSVSDADELARGLEVVPISISIQATVDLLYDSLASKFSHSDWDVTEENIQSRVRGIMLMALSNKNGGIVLSTGNKSEYACGYATIYGDMCGGFAPIKDVYKTHIYQLCEYRNNNIPSLALVKKLNLIPQNSILKPPSAELSYDQLDVDSLPPYEILDAILYEMIERNQTIASAEAMGYDGALVKKVYKMLKVSEYKRRQGALGTKISICNLSKDRRYPVTNKFEI